MSTRYHKNPKAQRLNNRIAFGIMLIFVPFFVLIGVAMIYGRITILSTYTLTTGQIVGADHQLSTRLRGGADKMISTKVLFATDDGTEIYYDSPFSSAKSDDIGESLYIFYNPQNPQDATILDFWDFCMQPILITLIGVVMLKVAPAMKNYVPPTMTAEDLKGDQKDSA